MSIENAGSVDPGVEGGADGGTDLSDAGLEAAAMAMAKEFGVEGATETAPADPAKPPAPISDTPAPPAAPDAAAVEAARIEALVAKQLEARQAAVRAHEHTSKLEQRVKELEAKLGKLKEAPLEVLESEGWDPESLAGAMVGAKNPADVKLRQMMARVKELEAAREADRTAAQEREAAAVAERNVATYIRQNVQTPLEANKSQYIHLIAEHGGIEGASRKVYDHLNALWRERGQEFPAVDVAKHLEAEAKKRFEAIRDQVTTSPAAVAPAPVAKTKPKTLSNNLTQAATDSDDDDLSDEALTRKAIEYARTTAGTTAA